MTKKINAARISEPQRQIIRNLFERPLVAIPHADFRRPTVMNRLMEQVVHVEPGVNLTAHEERTLFLQMNYCRHRMGILQRRLQRKATWAPAELETLSVWRQKEFQLRTQIVDANLGLVVAMSKRFVRTGLEYSDLIGEGNMALLHAAEKFDCSRGWRFSTYACNVILKALSRYACRNYTYRSRFTLSPEFDTEQDDLMVQQHRDKVQGLRDGIRDVLERNLADLSGVEQSIIKLRFFLLNHRGKPLTLKQVGERLGYTKERIRQLQKRSLEKLQTVTKEYILTN
jgi:RNA polymerase sigma factor (sigma-70 family)